MSETAIRCERLVKRYGTTAAVAGVELEVRAGCCFGLLGPNGAGKTTTVEMMEGLCRPTSGTIRLFGVEWGRGRDQELRQKFGAQLQDTQLADKLHVEEVLTLFRSFYARGKSVDELIELVDLAAERNQQFCRLSGGQKQRVAVACALVGDPELLFLDEPTTGLDPRARKSLWRIIERFRNAGGSVVLTTHYMEEAAYLCDEIAIMDRGKVISRGSPRALVDQLGDVQFLEFELSQEFDSDSILALAAVESAERRGNRYRFRIDRNLAALSTVLSELERQNLRPIGLSSHQATLDDVFLHLTGRELAVDTSQVALSESRDPPHLGNAED